MFRKFVIAAFVVASIPLAGAAAQQAKKSNYGTKKICKVEGETGSRLGGVKRCRTQQEWDELKRETRQQIDRAQNMKTTQCPPMC
jgi:hypothetical protein